MVEEALILQDIHIDDFLTIFVSSGLVIIFGGFYVGIYAAVKAELLKPWAMPLAYLAWVLTAYCFYLMGSLMHVNDFTVKAMTIGAVGLLLLPHAVFYMHHKVHEDNESVFEDNESVPAENKH